MYHLSLIYKVLEKVIYLLAGIIYVKLFLFLNLSLCCICLIGTYKHIVLC